MLKQALTAVGLFASAALTAAPAQADGEIIITHAKAVAGGVTADDAPGYPITLRFPGVYELGSNLFVPAGKSGIFVQEAPITIDLNGFTMFGFETAFHGIAGSVSSATIRNGTISRFKFNGIVASQLWTIEDMRILFNGGDGIRAGAFLRVEDSLINGNDGNGVTTTNNNWTTIRDSMITANGLDGIACAFRCHLEGNVIADNEGDGISILSGVVLGNTIESNFELGLNGFAAAGNNSFDANNGSTLNQQANTFDPLEPNYCSSATCP